MAQICFKCGLHISDGLSWYGLHHDCFKQSFQLPSLIKFQNLSSHRQSGETIPNSAKIPAFFMENSASILQLLENLSQERKEAFSKLISKRVRELWS
jgi:hypothetical protein